MMATDDDNSAPAVMELVARFLAVAAIFVPIGALSTGGYFQIREWPSAMAPFGFARIAAAYVLLSAPLVWWVAYHLARWLKPLWEAIALLTGLAGFVVAGATLGISSADTNWGNHWFERHAIRIGWVFALQLPFAVSSCVLAAAARDSANRQGRSLRWLDFGIALALILVVPTPFTDFVVRRQLAIVQSAKRNLQRHTALGVIARLNLFGSSLPEYPADGSSSISDQARAIRYARNNLASEEEPLRNQIALIKERIEVAQPTTDEHKIGLALDHYSLGQYTDARHLLTENNLHTSHEWGALVMGYICEQQRQPAEAAAHYERAIELEAATASPRENRLSSAYERLANTLRASGQGPKAETALKKGIEQQPEIRDRLTLQLGEHYLQAGRTGEAMDVFRNLSSRDDAIGRRAKSQIETLKSSMGSCFIRAN